MVRGLWLLAILVVIVGSLLPGDSAAIRALDRLPLSDKFDHFAAYLVLALLPAVHESRKFVIAAVLGAILLGVGLEYGQLFLSRERNFEILDMVADAAGAVAGLAIGIPLGSAKRVRAFLDPAKSPAAPALVNR